MNRQSSRMGDALIAPRAEFTAATGPAQPQVLCQSTLFVLWEVARRGLAIDPLLREAGLKSVDPWNPERRIPVRSLECLWEAARAATGDPLLALHAAERVAFGAYGTVDFMACTARHVGAALARVAECCATLRDDMRMEVVAGHDEVAFRVVRCHSRLALGREYAEYCLALCVARGRLSPSLAVHPLRVEFRGPERPDIHDQERIFGCPVRSGARHDQLVFSRREWERRLTPPRLELLRMLESFLDADQRSEGDPVVGEVRNRLALLIGKEELTLSRVARALGMHGRTLQRRLSLAGATFAELSDQVRRTRAESLLAQQSLSLAAVSEHLGYAEQSAFTRAFRKWTGGTPTEFRNTIQRVAESAELGQVAYSVPASSSVKSIVAHGQDDGGRDVAD